MARTGLCIRSDGNYGEGLGPGVRAAQIGGQTCYNIGKPSGAAIGRAEEKRAVD